MSQIIGGPTGTPFDDSAPDIVGVQKVSVWAGATGVEAIQATYNLQNGGAREGGKHGGPSQAQPSTFILAEGTDLNKMDVFTDEKSVLQLTFYDTKGQRHGPYPESISISGNVFTIPNPSRTIVSFLGRSSNKLDAIDVNTN